MSQACCLRFPVDGFALQANGQAIQPAFVPDRLARDGTLGWKPAEMPNPYGRPQLRRVPGPEGEAVEFVAWSAAWADLPPLEAQRPWTLSLWLRADERDWGAAKAGFPTLRYDLIRPVLVATTAWQLRLCGQRLEFNWGAWRIASQSEIRLGTWHHAAVVCDGGAIRLFLDGRPEMLCTPIAIDHMTGCRLRQAQITASGDLPEEARQAAAPLTAISLAQALKSEGWLGDFRGAIGGLILENRPWSGDEIARHFLERRAKARSLAKRYSALQDPVAGGISRRPDRQDEESAAYLARTAWWREARYGLFLHWSPSCLENLEISFGRCSGPLAEDYDRLYERFDPKLYDPASWADIAKRGGMRYVVLTAKHHDAFCLWPTASGARSVMDAPCRRDLVASFVKAMRAKGMRVGIYYSQRDLRTLPNLCRQPEGEGNPADIAYVRCQVEELCRNYAPDVLWFDGGVGGEVGIFRDLIRPLLPCGLVNDRNGNGDFVTPEGWVPPHPLVNSDGSDALWELATCAEVFGEGGWSYHAGATPRPYAEMLHELIETAAKGGNCLRGFGPMPDGRLSAAMVFQTEKIGRWLKQNSEAIYGTHRTRLGRQAFGWTTAKDEKVFLHVTEWPPAAVLQVKDFHDQAHDVRLLATGEPLPFSQEGDLLVVDLPLIPPDPIATVIAVQCAATSP